MGVSSHSQWCKWCVFISHVEVSNVHNTLLGLPCWPRGGVRQSKHQKIWVVVLFGHGGAASP